MLRAPNLDGIRRKRFGRVCLSLCWWSERPVPHLTHLSMTDECLVGIGCNKLYDHISQSISLGKRALRAAAANNFPKSHHVSASRQKGQHRAHSEHSWPFVHHSLVNRIKRVCIWLTLTHTQQLPLTEGLEHIGPAGFHYHVHNEKPTGGGGDGHLAIIK